MLLSMQYVNGAMSVVFYCLNYPPALFMLVLFITSDAVSCMLIGTYLYHTKSDFKKRALNIHQLNFMLQNYHRY